MSDLHSSLVNVHRDAEQHPFGNRMAQGKITKQEWANWLYASLCIQEQVDIYLPEILRRSPSLLLDLAALDQEGINPNTDIFDLDHLYDSMILGGFAYILSGANVKGGQVTRKSLAPLGFPVNHLTFKEGELALANEALVPLRAAFENKPETQKAFQEMIHIMDDIEVASTM